MTTTFTFKKRLPKKRRQAIFDAIKPEFRPKLTDTGITIRHGKKHGMAAINFFFMLHRDFTRIG